jgi:hypothetical protein
MRQPVMTQHPKIAQALRECGWREVREHPPGVSALDLEARALEHGISVAPGPIFSAKRRRARDKRMSAAVRAMPWRSAYASTVSWRK